MAGSFKNWNNILGDCAKENVVKSLVEAVNRYKKQEKEVKMTLKKYLSSLSWHAVEWD